MLRLLGVLGALVAAALAVLSSPQLSVIDAVAYEYPSLPALAANDRLAAAEHLLQGEVAGPESFAHDHATGTLYAGLADGRIVRLRTGARGGGEVEVETVVRTGAEDARCGAFALEHVCGRPLGLRLDPATGDLLVADAYLGLLRVDPATGAKSTVLGADVEVAGRRMVFPNDLDVTADGRTAYLSDSSASWTRREVLLEVMEAGANGRVLKVDLASGAASELATGIPFANGVSLSADESHVLVCSTTRSEVLAVSVATGRAAPFASSLPGTPDNIRRSQSGGYWVALGSRRAQPFALTHLIAPYPSVRRLLLKALGPWKILSLIPQFGLIVELDADGRVLQTMQDPTGRSAWISEVEQVGDFLYLGSFQAPYVGRVKL